MIEATMLTSALGIIFAVVGGVCAVYALWLSRAASTAAEEALAAAREASAAAAHAATLASYAAHTAKHAAQMANDRRVWLDRLPS